MSNQQTTPTDKFPVEATVIINVSEADYNDVLRVLSDASHARFGDDYISCSVMDREWAEYQRRRDAYQNSFWSRTQEAGALIFYIVAWLVIWPVARWFAPKPPKDPFDKL